MAKTPLVALVLTLALHLSGTLAAQERAGV
jgi:hypothetical protein